MKSSILLSLCVLGASATLYAAEEFASPKEAEAMVGKVAAALKANRSGTMAEITAKNAKWIDRDLYPTIYDLNGKVLAHGQNEKMVGKDLIDFKDPDGRPFVKERLDLAKSKDKFWQDYKFTDPISKKVLPKQAYCEKAGDVIICAGVYKR